jgi:hypothetical protein
VAQSGWRTEVERLDYTTISARRFLVTDEIDFGYKMTSTGCATGTAKARKLARGSPLQKPSPQWLSG